MKRGMDRKLHLCMQRCKYEQLYEWMEGQKGMNEWIDGLIDGCMAGRKMEKRMDG